MARQRNQYEIVFYRDKSQGSDTMIYIGDIYIGHGIPGHGYNGGLFEICNAILKSYYKLDIAVIPSATDLTEATRLLLKNFDNVFDITELGLFMRRCMTDECVDAVHSIDEQVGALYYIAMPTLYQHHFHIGNYSNIEHYGGVWSNYLSNIKHYGGVWTNYLALLSAIHLWLIPAKTPNRLKPSESYQARVSNPVVNKFNAIENKVYNAVNSYIRQAIKVLIDTRDDKLNWKDKLIPINITPQNLADAFLRSKIRVTGQNVYPDSFDKSGIIEIGECYMAASLFDIAWIEIYYALKNDIFANFCKYCGQLFPVYTQPSKICCGSKKCRQQREKEYRAKRYRNGKIDGHPINEYYAKYYQARKNAEAKFAEIPLPISKDQLEKRLRSIAESLNWINQGDSVDSKLKTLARWHKKWCSDNANDISKE